MNFAERIDYARCCEPAALRLWGEPNKALSNAKELRWGSHGSRSVNRQSGEWYDHEAGKGGSTIELVQEALGGGSFSEATAWLRREGLLQSRPVAPPLVKATSDWKRRNDTTTPAKEEAPALVTVQAATLADKDVPPREWEVDDWIPRRQVTLFAGDGGVGKTIVALQYALAAATATSWLGTLPREATVLYLGAEDEMAELHRRIAAIAAGTGVDLATATCLHLCSLIETDPAITTFTKTGDMQPTALLEAIRSKAQELAASVIIFDASADFFSGEENDRKQVRRFIAMLRRLGMQLDATIIILSHPSLTGMASGRGYSGTTAWNNSVRARLYLETLKDGDETPDNGLRILSTKKANYAATGQQIILEWHNGLFRPQPSGTTLEKAAADAMADNVFLTLLDRLIAQGRDASPNPSVTYAPTLMASFEEAKAIGKRQLEAAMNRLLQAGTIKVVTFGRPSRPSKKLVRS